MLIVQHTDKTCIKKGGAIVEAQVLTHAQGLIDIFLRIGRTEHIIIIRGVVLTAYSSRLQIGCHKTARMTDTTHTAHITYVVIEAEISERGECPNLVFTKAEIVHTMCSHTPDTIDIFWTRIAHTCSVIVDNARGDGVRRLREVEAEEHSCLLLWIVATILNLQRIYPRGFQTGITHSNEQRIAIIHHVEQVRHRRLRCRASVVELKLIGLGELVAEAHLRGDVEHFAYHGGIYVLSGAFVRQFCALWIETYASIETDYFIVVAHAQIHTIIEITIGGIL